MWLWVNSWPTVDRGGECVGGDSESVDVWQRGCTEHSTLQILIISVVVPWQFSSDPDPRIRTTDLRIRIRIRIRILFFFRQWLTSIQQKISFLLITFWRYIYISLQSSKIKSPKNWHVRGEIKVLFSYFFFACRWKHPNPYKIIRDPGGPKHTVTDPQHCWLCIYIIPQWKVQIRHNLYISLVKVWNCDDCRAARACQKHTVPGPQHW
jgi:hypothetical protein